MPYPEPKFSRNTIDTAGDTLISPASPLEVYEHALQVINNWRACHNLPLLFIRLGLTRIAKQVDPNCLIAQRIKRLPAIKLKLKLLQHRSLKLSEMQDIGGCRAVVKNLPAIMRLVNLYDGSRAKHKLDYKNDYIEKPKASGYRGVHLIYSYHSEKYETHNGLRIEIQIRSPLQHAWATAVETVGIFTGQALKSNLGSDDWKRFFALLGTAIAMKEKAKLVPKTPENRKELVEELRACASKLDAQKRLNTYSSMLRLPKQLGLKKSEYFLLELDPIAKKIHVTGYEKKELRQASERYLEVERAIATKSDGIGAQAVLVSVGSLASLKRAYPNYFLDMRVFIEEVERALTYSSS